MSNGINSGKLILEVILFWSDLKREMNAYHCFSWRNEIVFAKKAIVFLLVILKPERNKSMIFLPAMRMFATPWHTLNSLSRMYLKPKSVLSLPGVLQKAVTMTIEAVAPLSFQIML